MTEEEREKLRKVLEEHGATYSGYCAMCGEGIISEDDYDSEINRLATEYKSLFHSTPRDDVARLEAWMLFVRVNLTRHHS